MTTYKNYKHTVAGNPTLCYTSPEGFYNGFIVVIFKPTQPGSIRFESVWKSLGPSVAIKTKTLERSDKNVPDVFKDLSGRDQHLKHFRATFVVDQLHFAF